MLDASSSTGRTASAWRALRGVWLILALLWAPNASSADESQDTSTTQDNSSVSAPAATTMAPDKVETGLAAVYSDRLHRRQTASGQRYDRNALTAAHKTLPFGTRVKVTNKANGKSVVARINDRGPIQAGRILDISPRVAKALGMRRTAMAEVTAEVVADPKRRNSK